MRNLNVCLAFDSKYAQPALVTLRSVLESHPGHTVNALLLVDGIDERAIRNAVERISLPALGEVHIRQFDPDEWRPAIARGGLQDYVSPATFARISLAELAPAAWSSVLYLDSDVLVVDDLSGAFDQLGGSVIAATRCPWTPFIASPFGIQAWEDLGLNPSKPYFNAGVLAIDLVNWRARQVAERCREELDRIGSTLVQFDQELLNIVLADSWAELIPEYNVTTFWAPENDYIWSPNCDAEVRMRVRAQRRAIHYDGGLKPWKDRFARLDRFGFDDYRRLLACVHSLKPNVDGDSRS